MPLRKTPRTRTRKRIRRRAKSVKKRLKTIRDAEKALVHRVWDGTKELPAKELAAFIIQNAAEGFARGMVKEMQNQ